MRKSAILLFVSLNFSAFCQAPGDSLKNQSPLLGLFVFGGYESLQINYHITGTSDTYTAEPSSNTGSNKGAGLTFSLPIAKHLTFGSQFYYKRSHRDFHYSKKTSNGSHYGSLTDFKYSTESSSFTIIFQPGLQFGKKYHFYTTLGVYFSSPENQRVSGIETIKSHGVSSSGYEEYKDENIESVVPDFEFGGHFSVGFSIPLGKSMRVFAEASTSQPLTDSYALPQIKVSYFMLNAGLAIKLRKG